MARIRSIKPEFWSDLSLARLTRDARLLYIALWNQADEHGRLHGDARWIKGHCLPYDDDLNLGAIIRLLEELERAGKIVRYEAGEPYVFLPKLADHQRLEPGKTASRIPAPPGAAPQRPDPEPASSAPDAAPPEPATQRPAPRAEKSAPRADKPETGADSPEKIVALHVAGSMEHGAGRARTRASPRKPKPDPTDCQRVVGAWVDAATERQGERPSESLIARVGQQARALLGEGKDPDRLAVAAAAAGGKGFDDLGRELLRTGAGRPAVMETAGGWDV